MFKFCAGIGDRRTRGSLEWEQSNCWALGEDLSGVRKLDKGARRRVSRKSALPATVFSSQRGYRTNSEPRDGVLRTGVGQMEGGGKGAAAKFSDLRATGL